MMYVDYKMPKNEVAEVILGIRVRSSAGAKSSTSTDDPNIVQILGRQAVTLVKDVGVVTENEIRGSLEKIVYAVLQPNVLKIAEIIKNEIKNHFKINNPDAIYGKLETLFRDWCDTKQPLEQLSTNIQSNTSKQQVLTYVDANKIFQKYVKKVSFGVTAPTDTFTGRIQELEQIRKGLKKDSNLIVSQSVTVSGLGGIGKTQLVKQFIKRYGQTEYNERVIWIEAETDETVKNSFERLAPKLEIYGIGNKDIEVLIDEVFQYFDGLKVLFVFDNFDKTPANKGLLVNYCRKSTSSTINDRPFFIFTSRNRDCLPGVPLLDLEVLSSVDAVALIMNELTETNPTKANAEKLVKLLQCFPLALRQSIAYIKEQHKLSTVLGERYDIQDYFAKFEVETQDLLDFKFPDDFGEYGKTTFVTWNVTMDAIEADKVNGRNAIQVLKIFSYLYADKIDSNMFLWLFKHDKVKTSNAILLLEKYSMITKIEQEGTFYQIHRLVQAVVQLKFKKHEQAILERTFQLICPELYEMYFVNGRDSYDQMDECTVDQMLHYNTISIHMLKLKNLKVKYESFFADLNYTAFFNAIDYDNVEKLKTLKFSPDYLKRFVKKYIVGLIEQKTNKVIKYFLDNGYLRVNDRIEENSLIEWSLQHGNYEIFKFLIGKDADCTAVLKYASNELIFEIKNGKLDLFKKFISENNQHEQFEHILNECLLFATLFDQVSIFKILVHEFNPRFTKCPYIYVTAIFGYTSFMMLLLQNCIKLNVDLNETLVQLLEDMNFSDKKIFEIIFNKYLEKGGHVNDQVHDGESFLHYATREHLILAKLEIIYFLLDSGADPYLSSINGTNAVKNILEAHKSNRFSTDDKFRIDDLLNQKILNNLTPSNFINFAVKGLIKMYNWSDLDYYFEITFEKILKKIGDINVKNERGETLLINYVRNERSKLEIVRYLVDHGIDIDGQDNEKQSALYYVLKFENYDVFWYLLGRAKSVDENVMEKAIEKNKFRIERFEKCFPDDCRAKEAVSCKVVSLLKNEFKKQRKDVNKQDEYGETLLIKLVKHFKWKRDNLKLTDVEFFVENGVDVNLKDNKGKTALHYAFEFKNDDIFIYLLENSASVDEIILIKAIQRNRLGIVKALIPYNFPKDYLFKGSYVENKTPIELANECGHSSITNLLENLNLEFKITTDQNWNEKLSPRKILNDLLCCRK